MTSKMIIPLLICVLFLSCGVQGVSQNKQLWEENDDAGETTMSEKVKKSEIHPKI